jgi:uncharacterized repeat protein (TIGR03803 family)
MYGMTVGGGTAPDGTVFQIALNGTAFNVMHSFADGFNDGRNPSGSLLQVGSNFCGMTEFGGIAGNGVTFQISTSGTNFGVTHRFGGQPADGSGPLGSMIQSGGLVYGMTSAGGSANMGTIFRSAPDGSNYTVLHSFTGGPTDGQNPGYSSLVLSGSTLYGVTNGGGTAGYGTIFRMNIDGTGFSLLHSFDLFAGDGGNPGGSLVVSGTTLYGTTANGGVSGNGTVFRIGTSGAGYGQMYSFAGGPSDGSTPFGELTLSGPILYGMTAHGGSASLGTIFGIGADGSGYGLIHSFLGGASDGADPQGGLLLSGSDLYGMTLGGGSSDLGVIFSIAIPEPGSLALLGTVAAAAAGWAARRRYRCARQSAP